MDDHDRLLRIAQSASHEIATELLRVGRPASKVLIWLSAENDEIVGMSVFGHPGLLEELAKWDPAIDRLLANPLPPRTVRVVVKDEARGRRVAGHVRFGSAGRRRNRHGTGCAPTESAAVPRPRSRR
jgi:hypothetical protein